jgi:hypothetical protein
MKDKVLEVLERINESQLKTFTELQVFRDTSYTKILPTRQRGLYWLWTDLDYESLETSTRQNINAEVPISQLISQRKDLKMICGIKKDRFQVVYNGIGGYKTAKSFGLRERINQEVIGNGPTVGTLNILQNSDIKHWAVSYFNFDDSKNAEIIDLLDSQNPYLTHSKNLESLWRLQYGTPILCRH